MCKHNLFKAIIFFNIFSSLTYAVSTEQVQPNAHLSALEKHVLAFSEMRDDEKIKYSGNSIGTQLGELGSSKARLKGTLIHKFNAINSGRCSLTSTEFNHGDDGTFGYTLHLGTARIWNADGSINEDNLVDLIDSTYEFNAEVNDFIITESSLFEYIAQRQNTDPEEPKNGRYSSYKPFSKKVQHGAANGAWGEVFESLKSGEIDGEAYITSSRLEKFFRDTNLLVAELKHHK